MEIKNGFIFHLHTNDVESQFDEKISIEFQQA